MSSLPGLTRQSISFTKTSSDGWMPGSSPGVTIAGTEDGLSAAIPVISLRHRNHANIFAWSTARRNLRVVSFRQNGRNGRARKGDGFRKGSTRPGRL